MRGLSVLSATTYGLQDDNSHHLRIIPTYSSQRCFFGIAEMRCPQIYASAASTIPGLIAEIQYIESAIIQCENGEMPR